MNPSASGWLKKLLAILDESMLWNLDEALFYRQLKATGFIYGSNISLLEEQLSYLDLSEEETCKANMITGLYYFYKQEHCDLDFAESVFKFYKAIDGHKQSIFSEFLGGNSAQTSVEKIIHQRIHIDGFLITKNFNYFLINALLFTDILAFNYFLKGHNNLKSYMNKYEAALETVVFKVLNSKSIKTKYDLSLIKLFESSMRFQSHIEIKSSYIPQIVKTNLEKQYLIDAVCMASWSDTYIDKDEYAYLAQLRQTLKIETSVIEQSIDDINAFYKKHKKDIAFLNHRNLAQSFYDNSSNLVIRLIKRNSKRLLKELSQSKEAMVLLTKSTQRPLTETEQKIIQTQLLDIFKSIPSLAIFLLPGGMLLMPLFIKFIPQLLPSAFDDNRMDN
ncbi:LETM1-related biofilm-associated protein [Winogradskyella aurantiaca]|uniref:LETM1-related biofilm-associated protein n=1 Tax=Winogradskyella aurantiaca TaxID=2219558 RepID=UPI000E1D2184|nr:LETM1-related biofilm-associated protein [Winogradskyella aurantiaca]